MREDSRIWNQKPHVQSGSNHFDRITTTEANGSGAGETGKCRERPSTTSYKKTINPITYPNVLLQSALQRPVISSLRPGTAGRSRPLGTLRIFYLSKPLSYNEPQNIHYRSNEDRQWVMDANDPENIDTYISSTTEDIPLSTQTTPRTKSAKPITTITNACHNSSEDEEPTIFEDLSLLNPNKTKNTVNNCTFRTTQERRSGGLPPSGSRAPRRVASATVRQKPKLATSRKSSYSQAYRSSPWSQYRMHTECEEPRDRTQGSTPNGNGHCSSISELLQLLRPPTNGNSPSPGSRVRSSASNSTNISSVPCLSVSPVTFQLAKTPRMLIPRRNSKQPMTEYQGFQKSMTISREYSFVLDQGSRVVDEAARPKTASAHMDCQKHLENLNEAENKTDQTESTIKQIRESIATKTPAPSEMSFAQRTLSEEFWEEKLSQDVKEDPGSKENELLDPAPPEIEVKIGDYLVSSHIDPVHIELKDTTLVACPPKIIFEENAENVSMKNDIFIENASAVINLTLPSQEMITHKEHKIESNILSLGEFEPTVSVTSKPAERSFSDVCLISDEVHSSKTRENTILSQNWVTDTENQVLRNREEHTIEKVRSENSQPILSIQPLQLSNTTPNLSPDTSFIAQKSSDLNVKLTLLNKKASALEQQLNQSKTEKLNRQSEEVHTGTRDSADCSVEREDIIPPTEKASLTIDIQLQHANFSDEKSHNTSAENCDIALRDAKEDNITYEPFPPHTESELGASNEQNLGGTDNLEFSVEPLCASLATNVTVPDKNTLQELPKKEKRITRSTFTPCSVHKTPLISSIIPPKVMPSITQSNITAQLLCTETLTELCKDEQPKELADMNSAEESRNSATYPLKSILKRSCLSGRSSSNDINAGLEVVPSFSRSSFNRWTIYTGQQSTSIGRNITRRPQSAQTGHRNSLFGEINTRHGGTTGSYSKSPRSSGATRRSIVRFDIKNNSIFEFHPFDIVQTSFSTND
ncbi:unnamed protein product [Echinostoma caproni]|uniref:Non-specific serine/threonine protein kinase n=1 Tax=Echinostoma caproni TaxID=27848 RepID=A0A183AVY1_9TREM|nr:unnamed protein product [Echinostoma caproni]